MKEPSCLFKFIRVRGGLGCDSNLKTEAENSEFKVSLGNIVGVGRGEEEEKEEEEKWEQKG